MLLVPMGDKQEGGVPMGGGGLRVGPEPRPTLASGFVAPPRL